MADIDSDPAGGSQSNRSFERAAPYTNKGVIVDKYVRHNQDWIVPRRVMCAFFWTGIKLLFTGIILLVTSKHKKGGYQSWGAVLLGLGFCLLLICLILCMHAYCVITVADDEPDMVRTVPPPPPALLTLANGHKPVQSQDGASGHGSVSSVSYGSIQYNEGPQGMDTLKALPEEDECSCYNQEIKDSPSSSNTGYFRSSREREIYPGSMGGYESSPRMLKRSPVLQSKLEEAQCRKQGYRDNAMDISNKDKRNLESVGRLPSYSTAIKMPPYSPDRKRAYSYETEVDIEHLKEDMKVSSTLDRKRPQLKKSVTFDDSTGDLRVEFNGGEEDLHKTRSFLGSPPYDNELSLHEASIQQPPNIHEVSTQQSYELHDIPTQRTHDLHEESIVRTHDPHEVLPKQSNKMDETSPQQPCELHDITPRGHVLQESRAQPVNIHFHGDIVYSSSPQTLSTIPESPSSISDVSSTVAFTNTTWSHVAPQTHVPLLTVAPPGLMPQSEKHAHQSIHQSTATIHTPSGEHTILYRPFNKSSSYTHKTSGTSPDSSVPVYKKEASLDSVDAGASSQDQQNKDEVSRKTDVDSTGSSKMSVYDNVQYVWRPKSGSELKHYHF